MVNPASLAVAAAVILVLSNITYAHSEDDAIQRGGADVARHQRFLRVGVASGSSHDTALLGEEGAVFSQGSSTGHASSSADASHDDKPPAHHHRHDTLKDKPTDDKKADHLPSSQTDHDRDRHHEASASSSSMTGRHDAGDHVSVPPPPPSQSHGNTKDGDKHPSKGDGKSCGSDHQHRNPGNDSKLPHSDTNKDVAHDHGHGHGSDDAHAPRTDKDAAHKVAMSAKLSSASAGSADAYLTGAGSPHTTK
ncbi:hypothetical protein PRNP1_008068 [Phytophthora ramorum]